MDSFEKGQLSDSLRSQWFKKGEYVVKQGEQGDKFFFVEKGTAVAMK
jgi:cAMP-dependent protein kinase regulator